jgi:hypothetical protein
MQYILQAIMSVLLKNIVGVCLIATVFLTAADVAILAYRSSGATESCCCVGSSGNGECSCFASGASCCRPERSGECSFLQAPCSPFAPARVVETPKEIATLPVASCRVVFSDAIGYPIPRNSHADGITASSIFHPPRTPHRMS